MRIKPKPERRKSISTKLLVSVAVIVTFVAMLLPMHAPAQEKAAATGSTPDCYFVLHLEPNTANDNLFEVVTRLVELADQYKVKLTFGFTPQWAEMISADEKKLELLRKWQKDGHEVGAQHHALYHIGMWDGYTAIDPKELKETRTDMLGRSHQTEKYLGNMADYMELLNRLSAPEKVVTGTFNRGPSASAKVPSSEISFDGIPEGILYEVEGIKDPPQAPKLVEEDGRKHWRLPMFFVDSDAALSDLCEKYNLVTKEDVVGFVTHEFNFERTPEVIEKWFKFLQSKDPEGKHNKTVRQLMQERSALQAESKAAPTTETPRKSE